MIASVTQTQLENIADDLLQAAQLHDGEGYQKQVVDKLNDIFVEWPGELEEGHEKFEPFQTCRDAAGTLRSIGWALEDSPSLERQKRLKRYGEDFDNEMAACKKAINSH